MGRCGRMSPHRCLQTARIIAVPLLLAAVAAACSSDSSGPASPAASPGASPLPEATLAPVDAVRLAERATFYGRDAGDSAMGLALGDFNGDGVTDLALSAAFADGPRNGREDAGEVLLFFGPLDPGESRDAAAGRQDVLVFGADEGDQFGRASAAGDVNGDGIDDLLVGAPAADSLDNNRPDAGEAYVLFGRASWPEQIDVRSDKDAVIIWGADAGDYAGFTLITADPNSDGIRDLVVGAFLADGPGNARPDAGEAYLFFGGASWAESVDLAQGGQDAIFEGAEELDRLTEMMGAGDVNGDGVDDLILPANFASGPDNARVNAGEDYVILGGSLEPAYDMAQGQYDFAVLGPDPGDQLGHSLATGDFDGDGIDDMLLGAVSADGPGNERDLAGEFYLVPGNASPAAVLDTLHGAATLLVYGQNEVDRLGRSAAMGDLNGDGLADLVMAATGGDGEDESTQDSGELRVIFGRAGLRGMLDLARQPPDVTVYGLDADDVLGLGGLARLALLTSDIDGDGLDDVIVSARGDGPRNDRLDAGEAYILFARP